jgi:exosortase
MKTKDWLWLAVLTGFAALIWCRDLSWVGNASEVLPILGALPVFIWLGAPWRFNANPFGICVTTLVIAVGLFLAGTLFNLTILMALSWTLAAWSWLKVRLEPADRPRINRLLVLLIMAFPWVTLDAGEVGWWFRLSAAWVTQHVCLLAGLTVTRDGTFLNVQGLPISVEAACSGLKALQAMLIAGTMLAFIQLGRSRVYWWSLPLLIALAWLANTARVFMLTAVALTFGTEFAEGWFHAWGGWFVLMSMFALCWITFALLNWQFPPAKASPSPAPAPAPDPAKS